jgi:uncharacterized protein YukE
VKRISHDLPGVAQRMARLSDRLESEIDATRQIWKDDTGRSFLQQHYAEAKPTVMQLVSELSESVELFEQIAKRLRDPKMM